MAGSRLEFHPGGPRRSGGHHRRSSGKTPGRPGPGAGPAADAQGVVLKVWLFGSYVPSDTTTFSCCTTSPATSVSSDFGGATAT